GLLHIVELEEPGSGSGIEQEPPNDQPTRLLHHRYVRTPGGDELLVAGGAPEATCVRHPKIPQIIKKDGLPAGSSQWRGGSELADVLQNQPDVFQLRGHIEVDDLPIDGGPIRLYDGLG